ncbi:DUF4351 domain-containing protein [Calothrix sp. NIES-2100]|uniref:DUF4351 domain-containing protein n=1 Tax=Calothrix sp. NIES-2100 TaxID=1954172 RepID=UPI000BBC8106
MENLSPEQLENLGEALLDFTGLKNSAVQALAVDVKSDRAISIFTKAHVVLIC